MLPLSYSSWSSFLIVNCCNGFWSSLSPLAIGLTVCLIFLSSIEFLHLSLVTTNNALDCTSNTLMGAPNICEVHWFVSVPIGKHPSLPTPWDQLLFPSPFCWIYTEKDLILLHSYFTYCIFTALGEYPEHPSFILSLIIGPLKTSLLFTSFLIVQLRG